MAAAAKKIRTQAGTTMRAPTATASRHAVPPVLQQDMADALVQLQNTVNELIARFNAHQHSALNAAPSVGLVTGTAQAATNLFTDN